MKAYPLFGAENLRIKFGDGMKGKGKCLTGELVLKNQR